MAVVFILGPGEWDAAKGQPPRKSPREVRERIGEIVRGAGHDAFLMEDEPDRPGEDLVEKFDRLLHARRVTDVLVYWPPAAKMATTFDELLLLRDRIHRRHLPRLWLLHHRGVARVTRSRLAIRERGGRSRYLDSIARLRPRGIPWWDDVSMKQAVIGLASRLTRDEPH